MFLEMIKNKLIENYEKQVKDLTGDCDEFPPEKEGEVEIIRTPGHLFRLGKDKEQVPIEPS